MPFISIVIATFNSAQTLPLVLDSIRGQTYPKDCIEILIIDGGSTDRTLALGKKYKCRVIKNSKVEPLFAKYLGYIHAKGKYIFYLDHDEVMINRNSLKDKVKIFLQNPDIKVVIASGYRSPKNYYAINRYINEFGDPFSFFIYRMSKNPDFFLSTMQTRYHTVKENKTYAVIDLASSQNIPIIELTTASSAIDGEFYKKTLPDLRKKYHLIPHLVQLLRTSYPYIAILKHDELLHYSSDNLDRYMQKIIWRIKNNIFYTGTIGASGFSGRESYQTTLSRTKKFMFLPYAFSVVLPAADAMYLMATRKNLSYIIHLPLTIITAVLIVYYIFLKLIGVKPVLRSYDGSTIAYENN